jgi:hypothetical protein
MIIEAWVAQAQEVGIVGYAKFFYVRLSLRKSFVLIGVANRHMPATRMKY